MNEFLACTLYLDEFIKVVSFAVCTFKTENKGTIDFMAQALILLRHYCRVSGQFNRDIVLSFSVHFEGGSIILKRPDNNIL